MGKAGLGDCPPLPPVGAAPVQPTPPAPCRGCATQGFKKPKPTLPAHAVPCKCWIPHPSSCRGAAPPADGVSRGADGKFLLRRSTSGPACSRQLPRPTEQSQVILPAGACARELPKDQLLNPAFSVPAQRKRYCFWFHVERAVRGPSCHPRVPFPPKIIAPAAAGTAESVPAPTRIPVSGIGAGVRASAGSLHPRRPLLLPPLCLQLPAKRAFGFGDHKG